MLDSKEDFWERLDKIREAHRDEFEAWYETANYPSIHDHALTGWLIGRYLEELI